VELLRSAIERHLIATQSPRAQWILEHWADTLPQFIKVFPHEYKRVLGIPRLAGAQKIQSTVVYSGEKQVKHG
jgi:glutamate synthase domain-containing protein 3